ncbi:hypothetical protein Q8A67_022610 [Cirrhinus molitorella]|uniref:Uncharacterized protein n=1 Tax=Cirrhinus molitorella TaxID=172907 RepID=A0AA88P765_9TELE|nr:hypothetical protein Q8A67_022610 [Cirrhinus molitorella]
MRVFSNCRERVLTLEAAFHVSEEPQWEWRTLVVAVLDLSAVVNGLLSNTGAISETGTINRPPHFGLWCVQGRGLSPSVCWAISMETAERKSWAPEAPLSHRSLSSSLRMHLCSVSQMESKCP